MVKSVKVSKPAAPTRSHEVRVKLTPKIRSLFNAHAANVGIPPSTLAAIVLADWCRKQEIGYQILAGAAAKDLFHAD
jgi:hypothetical protein